MSGTGNEGEVPPEDDAPEDTAEAPTSRARARVNRPAPRTKTFGVDPPAFVKVAGRSPGSESPAESGRRFAGELPASAAARPAELDRPAPGPLANLLRRLRGVSRNEKLLAVAILAALLFAIVVARVRL